MLIVLKYILRPKDLFFPLRTNQVGGLVKGLGTLTQDAGWWRGSPRGACEHAMLRAVLQIEANQPREFAVSREEKGSGRAIGTGNHEPRG